MAEPPPLLTANEYRTKRFKVIWRVLLISNLALGAYMFVSPKKKDVNLIKSKLLHKTKEQGKAFEETPLSPGLDPAVIMPDLISENRNP